MRFGRLTCVLVLVAVSGCTQTDCNDVGCDTGVLVTSEDVFAVEALPLSVTVCADQVCTTERIDASNVDPGQQFAHVYTLVDVDDERERDVAVTLEVRSEATGEILADANGTGHLERLQPNGESCGPTCYFARLTYDGITKSLVMAVD